MATAAAIDRVMHHSVILEFDVPSYRTDAAQQRGQAEEVNPAKLIDANAISILREDPKEEARILRKYLVRGLEPILITQQL